MRKSGEIVCDTARARTGICGRASPDTRNYRVNCSKIARAPIFFPSKGNEGYDNGKPTF
jgi:hypothetical protein